MSKLIEGETYVVTSAQPWVVREYGIGVGNLLTLIRIETDNSHLWKTETGFEIFLTVGKSAFMDEPSATVEWYDAQCAMREVVNEPVNESETEWRLPAGTFFRVNGKHEPLYLVMSNSHVFNLTAKQMHTTCSSRFKDKQLSVANVQMSEVL